MSGSDPAALFAQADQLARAGQRDQAAAILRRILTIEPAAPRALNALGNHMLAGGDPDEARRLFRRAVASDPAAGPVWLNLALACRTAGDADGELDALEGALAADPYFMLALLQKAQWSERHGRMADAARNYQGLIDAAPPREQLAPAFRQALHHGERLIAAHKARQDEAIRAAIGDRAIGSERFRHCLDVLAGRRTVYTPRPAGLHYPYLPAIQFFDRALFPWFDRLEAATGLIRDELAALTLAGVTNRPYVQVSAGQPVNQWAALNHSLDWGAIFLWKDGAAVESNLALCPGTSALLRESPLLDIAGRGPTVMFSTLVPGAHIPAHHGVTNTRVVVHLPLIAPAGCRFRVGSETRPWRLGEAWAFDDTIEHEAWNDSAETRVILIVDAWNPLLDEEERALLRTTAQVLRSAAFSDTGGG